MVTHTIKTVQGKFIEDEEIINEVKSMLHNGLNYTYIQGKKVSVHSDFRKDGERISVIEVEGI